MTVPTVVGREVLLDNEWLQVAAKVVRGMPGSSGDQHYYVIRPRDYVSVVATTPARQLILVRQYRPAIERVTLELPSGLLDPGETPEATALRELAEETGHVVDGVQHIGTLIPDTGRYENTLWCYAAHDARPSPEWAVTEEGMEPVLVDLHEIPKLLQSSEFDHALHVAALMLALVGGHLPGMLTS